MKTVNLNDRQTFYASDDLVRELKSKIQPEDVVINFAYTDYGGTFFDKVIIQYFEEKHPDSIVSETTAWYGQNAFIFGSVAKEFIEANENYPLGFEDTEEYYFLKESETEREDFEQFLKDLDQDEFEVKENALDFLLENRSGYYSITTQGIDYSYSELEQYCIDNGIIVEIPEVEEEEEHNDSPSLDNSDIQP